MVVDPTELVELGLQLGEVGGQPAFLTQPLLQGLLEPFDFAGGLRVEWSTGDRSHPDIT